MIGDFDEDGRCCNAAQLCQCDIGDDVDELRIRIDPLQIVGEDRCRFVTAGAVTIIINVRAAELACQRFRRRVGVERQMKIVNSCV